MWLIVNSTTNIGVAGLPLLLSCHYVEDDNDDDDNDDDDDDDENDDDDDDVHVHV